MNRICKTVPLIAFLALLTTAPAFTQTPSAEAITEATAAAPVAHVYVVKYVEVPTNTTINLYNAAADGKLTQAGDYTLNTVENLIGSNGKYMLASSGNFVYAYAVEPNGALGAQVSTVNIQDYANSECLGTRDFTIYDAKLDHTGKYLYALAYNGFSCYSWQSYAIGQNGDLTFLGETPGYYVGPIDTISSSDTFAYGENGQNSGTCEDNSFTAFIRNGAGVLEPNLSFTHKDPKHAPSEGGLESGYFPFWVTADPVGHLAVLMSGCPSSTTTSNNLAPAYLASYTIDKATGSIASTNTSKDMPVTNVEATLPLNALDPMFMKMSPSGKFLAVAGGGVQVFHFNGADPITPLSKVLLTGLGEFQMAWDNNDHLYVSNGNLYVYTVTPKGVVEVPGSPFARNTFGALVVPKP